MKLFITLNSNTNPENKRKSQNSTNYKNHIIARSKNKLLLNSNKDMKISYLENNEITIYAQQLPVDDPLVGEDPIDDELPPGVVDPGDTEPDAEAPNDELPPGTEIPGGTPPQDAEEINIGMFDMKI